MKNNDTIAAVATAPGKGGIAIVRISGPRSTALVKRLFSGKHNPEKLNRVMVYGHIVDGDTPLDEVLVCIMKYPHSYTGEDVAEIHCHGGYAAAGAILEKLVEHGVRLAEPGEFTKRAFLNGRIDLVQAESVMEIVAAEGREHLKRAERLMEGAFSKRIETLLEDLKESLMLLELNIDFLHQGLEAIKERELKESIHRIISTLDTMIVSYQTGKRIKDGLRVVLAGSVNSGKSSLFNALLGRKRAIVNGSPGTTRDWLEERIDLDGIAINLVDTAGLRDAENDIEREGVLESERLLDDADIIVYLVACTDTEHADRDRFCDRDHVIQVLSKSDLLDTPHEITGVSIPVSAKTVQGLTRLTDELSSMARSFILNSSGDSLVMIERHTIELKHARDALYSALESIDSWSEEVTALELREAQKHIEAIIGRNIDLDVLDAVFKNFCIGK